MNMSKADQSISPADEASPTSNSDIFNAPNMPSEYIAIGEQFPILINGIPATPKAPVDTTNLPKRAIRVSGRRFQAFARKAGAEPRRSFLFLPVLSPTSRTAIVWSAISALTDISYTAYIVPLSIAFGGYIYEGLDAFFGMDMFGNVVYFLDIMFGFHVGYAVQWDLQSVVITDGPSVAKRYIKSGGFWIDFIAFIPALAQIVIAATQESTAVAKLVALLRLLRLVRVVRIISSLQRFNGDNFISQVMASYLNPFSMFIVITLFSMSVLVNLLGCLWWFVAVQEDITGSWADPLYLNKPLIDLETSSDGTRYIISIYFALTVISTVGFGDITCQTGAECLLVMFFMLIGVGFFGYFLSAVNDIIQGGGQEMNKKIIIKDKVNAAEWWMNDWKFPAALKHDIRKFYYSSYGFIINEDTETDLEFLNDLPPSLRLRVAGEMQSGVLKETIFSSSRYDNLPETAKQTFMEVIRMHGEPMKIKAKDVLFEKNDKAEHLYLLDEGEIKMSSTAAASYVVPAPAVIGIWALAGVDVDACAICLASGTAQTACRLWKIDARVLYLLEARCPEVLMRVMQVQLEKDVLGLQQWEKYIEEGGRMTMGIEESLNKMKERVEAAAAWVGEMVRRADAVKRGAKVSDDGGFDGGHKESSAAVGREDNNNDGSDTYSSARSRLKVRECNGFNLDSGSYLGPSRRAQLIIQQSRRRRRKGKSGKKKMEQQQEEEGETKRREGLNYGYHCGRHGEQEAQQDDVELGQLDLAPSLVIALGGNVTSTEVSNRDID